MNKYHPEETQEIIFPESVKYSKECQRHVLSGQTDLDYIPAETLKAVPMGASLDLSFLICRMDLSTVCFLWLLGINTCKMLEQCLMWRRSDNVRCCHLS